MKRYYIYKIQTEEIPTPIPESTDEDDEELIEESSLPESYQPSQNCGNCAAYVELTGMCSLWNAPVDVTYWCSSWTDTIGELDER
jgi:hypothetical protein